MSHGPMAQCTLTNGHPLSTCTFHTPIPINKTTSLPLFALLPSSSLSHLDMYLRECSSFTLHFSLPFCTLGGHTLINLLFSFTPPEQQM